MVEEVTKYVCSICGKEYNNRLEAEKCESIGTRSGNFCFDLHSKLILCAHANSCMHFNNHGHIGSDVNCNDFAPRKANAIPKYYKIGD